MDRLQRRVGFRVHAHAFRHTYATVATKLGWNFEHLRAAMGHAKVQGAAAVRAALIGLLIGTGVAMIAALGPLVSAITRPLVAAPRPR